MLPLPEVNRFSATATDLYDSSCIWEVVCVTELTVASSETTEIDNNINVATKVTTVSTASKLLVTAVTGESYVSLGFLEAEPFRDIKKTVFR